MQVVSTQKYIRTSPRKLRLVVGMVKDLSPLDAFERLPFTGKRAAEPVRKTLGTALANAKDKGLDEKELVFKEIQIGEGPRMKRWRAGARGRAKPYKRRMSHIRVVLTTRKSESQNPKSKTKSNVSNSKKENEGKTSKTEKLQKLTKKNVKKIKI
jgi:large subunit ribosomal protein L22